MSDEKRVNEIKEAMKHSIDACTSVDELKDLVYGWDAQVALW
jgi:hypothetical protein